MSVYSDILLHYSLSFLCYGVKNKSLLNYTPGNDVIFDTMWSFAPQTRATIREPSARGVVPAPFFWKTNL